MPTLSSRGQDLACQPLRADFAFFERAMANHYHPTDNPDGAIPLCIAENLLSWPLVRERLQRPLRDGDFPDWVASYAPIVGHPDTRTAIASFLERHLVGRAIDPESMALAAGATAIIELTAMLLGDRGDIALFPAPTYQVYAHDVGAKAGMDVDFLTDPPTAAALDRKLAEHGDRLRMLVLTSPNNPDGLIYSEDTLREIADWCTDHRVHLVVNEIYALSRFTGAEDPPYVSFLSLLEDRQSPYLHWWYSFSKDFGISGLRVGVLYSRNADLINGMGNIAAPHQVGNPVQFMLAELLSDHEWVDRYITLNQRRLTTAYHQVTDRLDALGIPYTPARGSLFVFMDLGGFLPERTETACLDIHEEIFERTGVLLTAPLGFGLEELGWFRLVYSGVEADTLTVALDRLEQFLAAEMS